MMRVLGPWADRRPRLLCGVAAVLVGGLLAVAGVLVAVQIDRNAAQAEHDRVQQAAIRAASRLEMELDLRRVALQIAVATLRQSLSGQGDGVADTVLQAVPPRARFSALLLFDGEGERVLYAAPRLFVTPDSVRTLMESQDSDVLGPIQVGYKEMVVARAPLGTRLAGTAATVVALFEMEPLLAAAGVDGQAVVLHTHAPNLPPSTQALSVAVDHPALQWWASAPVAGHTPRNALLVTLLATLAAATAGGVGAARLGRELLRRRLAERGLRASGLRLERILESVSDWVWETDADGAYTYLSPRASEQFGRAARDLLAHHRTDLAAGPEDVRVLDALQDTIAAHEVFRDVRYRILLPEGDIRHLCLSGRPCFDEDGLFSGYIGTGSDVTDEVEAAARAAIAETRLKAAIEGMSEGFALFDVRDRLVLRNRRLRRLLGAMGAEFTDSVGLRVMIQGAAMTPGEVDAYFSDLFRNQIRPLRLRARNGRWLQVRLEPTTDNGTLTLWSDITDVVEAEKKKAVVEREQRHAQKMEAIGTLAGGIAHEINTPIQYIGDNVSFLSEAFQQLLGAVTAASAHVPAGTIDTGEVDFLRDEVPLALEQTADGVKQVATIVLAMKEFAHPSAREPVLFDLNHALRTTATVCRNEWKHVAELTFDLADALPEVMGVPGEVNQVFLNLLVNAAHAVGDAARAAGDAGRAQGRITVASRRAAQGVEIAVTDNGCGMAPDVVEKVFDPFFTTKDVGRGTGQGLAIAHDIIVRKHQGRITVTSQPGEGSTFTVFLPLPLEAAPASRPALAGE